MARRPAEPRRIAFLGFGLIAGSIAKAVRSAGTRATLVAWTPSGAAPRIAADAGVLDEAAETRAAAVRGADLVVLAGPTTAIVASLDELGPARSSLVENGVTITDVGSTKGRILERADANRLPFVGGHPMAGRETAGYVAATDELFVGRPWAVVPGAAAIARDVDRVEWLARIVGARPVRMAAAAHDEAVAAISHLPLVVAAALVEAVASADDWPAARALAAGGWRDVTRIARGDPAMGAAILATNAPAVVARLEAMRLAIDAWLAVLRPGPNGPDELVLRDRLEAARAALAAGSEPSG